MCLIDDCYNFSSIGYFFLKNYMKMNFCLCCDSFDFIIVNFILSQVLGLCVVNNHWVWLNDCDSFVVNCLTIVGKRLDSRRLITHLPYHHLHMSQMTLRNHWTLEGKACLFSWHEQWRPPHPFIQTSEQLRGVEALKSIKKRTHTHNWLNPHP